VKRKQPAAAEEVVAVHGLSPQQLAEVFPFHLGVDRRLHVVQYGPGLQRLCPALRLGQPFSAHLRVARPNVPLDFDRMATLRRALFVLESLQGGWRLRGQLVPAMGGEVLLFLGSPWVTDVEQVSRLGLGLSDYAVQDPMVDYLFLVQQLHTALADARRHGDAQARKLLRNQWEFRQLIERLPEGVALHRDGAWVYANPAFCSSLGYGGPELLVSQAVAELVPDGEQEAWEALGLLGSPAEESPPARECRLQRQDGTLATLLLASVPVAEFDGGPATLVLARDLTEQKRLQARLMLADRMASVGTLASGVAHEINNPLSYVISNLRFVLEQVGEVGRRARVEGMEELQEALQEALEGADRVRNIVQDLRTLSKDDESSVGPIDVQRVVESALKLAASTLRHKAQVRKELKPVPAVEGNAARLGQVMLNLLINASQALPEAQPEHNEIRVATRTDPAGRALIEVQDTGEGITPENLGRLFDPFFTTKPVGVGTGLGLSICHGIVTSMGGEIQVESAPHQGSLFRVVLPAFGATGKAQSRGSEPEPSRSGRILVVDDDAYVAAAISRALRPQHELESVTSAREALARMGQGQRFDLILCDLMMPDMTGMELYAELSQLVPEQAERMVFLTGGTYTQAAEDFLQQVVNPRLEKPFEVKALRTAVQQWIERAG
jgi:two-component system, cell cycle sensor histidine kinase and response regulator CckA